MDCKEMRIPIGGNFEMKYYCQDSSKIDSAHVFPPHIHDTLEFYVLLEGDVSFMVEQTLYKLCAGDIIVSKPNEVHNCILNSDSQHRHMCFWFDPSCDFLFSHFLAHDFGQDNLCSPTAEDGEKILSICRELALLDPEAEKSFAYSLAIQFLHYVGRNLCNGGRGEPLPELLRAILNDIHDNLPKIRSLSYFEEKYFISPSTLNRLFHKHLHTSPKYYLETKRLALSRLFLCQGYSVFEAGELSGFSDYSNYIRLFRTRFGITPLRYRNSLSLR